MTSTGVHDAASFETRAVNLLFPCLELLHPPPGERVMLSLVLGGFRREDETMTSKTDDFTSLMEITPRPAISFVSGQGSWLTDSHGKRYLDFIQGWAVNCLGHCPAPWSAPFRSRRQG